MSQSSQSSYFWFNLIHVILDAISSHKKELVKSDVNKKHNVASE